MFQIIVFLFEITNGVVAPDSSGSMRSKMQFPTMEVCETYLASDEGAVIKAMITNSEPVKTKRVAVEFRCMNMGDPL